MSFIPGLDIANGSFLLFGLVGGKTGTPVANPRHP
jgi:hypothetical protein